MENQPRPPRVNKTQKRFWFWLGLLGLFGLSYILLASTPDNVGPIGITVFFILTGLTLFTLLMWVRARVLSEPTSISLLTAVIISVLSTGALALNTIDIQIGEILLLVIFGAMLCVYWLKVR